MLMKYPKQYLEEIKNRLKVSTVISKTINLKKRGKEFVGLSPFKNEKTPSFTVNDEKGFYHCFSSGEHGNIFDFLMKTQNLNFGETVKLLASQAGMPIYRFSKLDQEREKKWNTYSEILNEYKLFYNNEIKKNNLPDLKTYLSKRGITDKEIENFKIGYVPKNCSFLETLSKKYSEKDILLSGLFYFDEKKKRFIERFRDRIIFPINDLNGSTIAFGGRVISNKNIFAKYINSSETPFFKKGNNLFNLDVARKFCNQNDTIFLVEGYMDVISLNKFAIMNVVANLGTALTNLQIQLIWRFYKHIIICFDGDKGGHDAAIRAADKLIETIKPDFKISFLFLPSPHDPDSFIYKFGKNNFLSYEKNKIYIHEFIWNHYSQNINTKDPSSMANFENKLKEKFNLIKDEIVKKYTLEFLYDRLSLFTPASVYSKKNYQNYKKHKPLRETKEIFMKKRNYNEIELKEFSILYLIINNFNIFKKNIELLSELNLYSSESKNFLKEIIIFLSQNDVDNAKANNLKFIKDKYKELIKKINFLVPIKFILKSKKEENEIISIYEEITEELKKFDINKKIDSLEKKLIHNMDEQTYKELVDLKKQANGA